MWAAPQLAKPTRFLVIIGMPDCMNSGSFGSIKRKSRYGDRWQAAVKSTALARASPAPSTRKPWIHSLRVCIGLDPLARASSLYWLGSTRLPSGARFTRGAAHATPNVSLPHAPGVNRMPLTLRNPPSLWMGREERAVRANCGKTRFFGTLPDRDRVRPSRREGKIRGIRRYPHARIEEWKPPTTLDSNRAILEIRPGGQKNP
jgi:hypothetical protein